MLLKKKKKDYFQIRSYSQVHKVRTSTYLLWGHSSVQNKDIEVILPPKARYPGVLRDGGSSWGLIRCPGLGPRLEVLGCDGAWGCPVGDSTAPQLGAS